MKLPPILEYALQAMLPTRLLSSLMHRATQIRTPWLKNTSIRFVLRHFDVDMSEAVEPDALAYPTFNAFFTRALKPQARPLADEPALLSPVDGRISQWGRIEGDTIFQAKGRSFSASALLGDATAAKVFRNGHFATIYLAPNNYHRIHMPRTARLISARYLPGRLFSVQPSTARAIDRLFARNERHVMWFESDGQPMAMVLVGALFVGSIETVVDGKISPPHSRQPREFTYSEGGVALQRGQEVGRFNMGSTVILLLPEGAVDWRQDLGPDSPVRMGQALGQLTG